MTTLERVLNLTPVDRQVNQLQPRQEKTPSQPKSIKGWWNRFFAALLLSSQLSACISAESRFVVPTDTEPRVVATSVLPPQKSPESAAPTVPQPSPTATKEALAPTPTYTVEASGGTYTTAQDKLNKSPEALSQQQRLQRWLDYWVQFDNRPFALDSADIHWKYIYDNAKNPKEVMTLLEVSGPDYQNKLFTVPMNEEGFVDYPPTVTGKYIQPGLGPLEINPHKDNTILSVDQGTLVRLDSQGKIVERLSQAHWEAESLIKGDIFQDPQSKAEFDTVVLAPSPIDDPENFALFQEEYLQKINEQAETYRDQAIDDTFRIGSRGDFLFYSSVWKPIASYKFKWEGQEILNKTFLYTSQQGDLVPITLTYTPEDSWFFADSFQTPDGSQKMDLYVLYAFKESMKKEFPDDFLDHFLPTDTSQELNEAIIRIWRQGETPTSADYEIVSKMPLILWGFVEHK